MEPLTDKVHPLLSDSVPNIVKKLGDLTAESVINLFTTLLLGCGIDISKIDQPTPEQYDAIEDSNIINLINLHTALAQIFDKIFLTDFSITDLTSPDKKRIQNQVKLLVNFVSYVIYKRQEHNDRMNKIRTTCKLIEELKEKKGEILESINNKALHNSKQLFLVKKIESEIQHMQRKIEKDKQKSLELEVITSDAEKENQKAKELCVSAKTETGKVCKAIAELQSEIVHSPEQYNARVDKLVKEKNSKVKERDVVQEAIQDKKQSIKHIEEYSGFIQKISDELVTLKSICGRLKDYKTQLDNRRNKIELLRNEWNYKQNKLAMHKDQVDTEKNELQSIHKEDIASLHQEYAELMSEKKSMKTKLKESTVIYNEKCLVKKKLDEDIKKTEEKSTTFLRGCQEMYDREIAEELELRQLYQGTAVKEM